MSARRLPRLVLLAALAVLVVVAIARAALDHGAKPPARPLAVAVHDALTAPPVPGVTARIRFTDNLVSSGALPRGMSSPLLAGATGRAWVAADGRFRLELQSADGDDQLVSDGRNLTFYDARHDTVYTLALPHRADRGRRDLAPSLADVRRGLARLARHAVVSGATPTNVAGRPAYSVDVAPRHAGGLLGAITVAWDAARGVPLRLAVTARGASSPVLALEATDVSYAGVPASVLAAPDPPGAKHVVVHLPTGASGHGRRTATGLRAVRSGAGFAVVAPARLGGQPRRGVRLAGRRGVLVTYGRGLSGYAVLETPASARRAGMFGGLQRVSVGSASGRELPSALGALVSFSRGGVSYVVAGSHPAGAVLAVARELAGR